MPGQSIGVLALTPHGRDPDLSGRLPAPGVSTFVEGFMIGQVPGPGIRMRQEAPGALQAISIPGDCKGLFRYGYVGQGIDDQS